EIRCGPAWSQTRRWFPFHLSLSPPRTRYGIHTSLQNHPASFDKLRMRGNLGGTKKSPHPELVEGRMLAIPVSCKRLIRLENLCESRSAFAGVQGSRSVSCPGSPAFARATL